MDHDHNEQYRYGSAGWSDEQALNRAGLFGKGGLHEGYFGQRVLRLDSDAPTLTIGGAGSGKLRDQLGYVVCNSPSAPMLILDPRGEMGAISIHTHTRHDEFAYFWNATGLCGLPQHSCNPLDILTRDSPHLFGDCLFITEGLIPLSGGGNGKYFELRARDWLQFIMIGRVERRGYISFPDLYRIINMIEADPQGWANVLEAMLASQYRDVRRVAAEMLAKQQDSPKEFGSIIGELYAYLNFLADPALLAALDGSDFSLETLCSKTRTSKIFLNVPAEYLSIWAPILRVFFTVAMLYKSRAPQARRVNFVIDEAGQLGSFEALLRSFTFGRGAGVRSWAVFQDAGQIVRNFGGPALQGFLGSAQTRQFFGVRDYQTAQLISNMLGMETLEYDDVLAQDMAKRDKRNAAMRMIASDDPFGAAFDYAHYKRAEQTRTKQSRLLMTPEEVLSMPEDRQILFISGKNLKPIYAHKYPYYTRREMAGLYLPNPYHPPADKVRVMSRFGEKWAQVITCDVPQRYALYPQYQSGRMSYVEGYKPY
jgi:type IV secretion system protein VirD4